ncbi:MAG: hypothetical protein GX225_01955 [Clostridiales bacterium]|nr:hypothetical protein [Clostridiales bacterium]
MDYPAFEKLAAAHSAMLVKHMIPIYMHRKNCCQPDLIQTRLVAVSFYVKYKVI